MTILGRNIRSTKSNGFLAGVAWANRRPATRRSPVAELPGMVTLVPAVDFIALRDLIDGNPRR
jgi:hypothetical protein